MGEKNTKLSTLGFCIGFSISTAPLYPLGITHKPQIGNYG